MSNIIRKPSMSGAEVARELGITRQAVSQILKTGLEKMYFKLKKSELFDGPWEIMYELIKFFGMGDVNDTKQFISLFPYKIRKEVKEDARTRFPGFQKTV